MNEKMIEIELIKCVTHKKELQFNLKIWLLLRPKGLQEMSSLKPFLKQ